MATESIRGATSAEQGLEEPLAEGEAATATGRVGAVSIELYRPSIIESLREARRNLPVARALFRIAFDFSQKGMILGWWWIPISFAFDTFVKALIFGRVLNAPSPSKIPYFLFLATGNAAWILFHRGTLLTMKSFRGMRRYVSGLDIPLLFIPLAGVVQACVVLVFMLGFLAGGFVVFLLLDGELYLNVGPELLLAPVALAWLALITVSWGFISAPIYWRARDIRQIYRMMLPMLMYITPVIYPVSAVPGVWGVLARLNPLAPPIELFKLALLGIGSTPTYSIISSLGITAAMCATGLWFLNRYSLRLLGVGPGDDEDDET